MKEINMTKAISCMPDKFITMEMVELAATEHRPELVNYLPEKYITSEILDSIFKTDDYGWRSWQLSKIPEEKRNRQICLRAIKAEKSNFPDIPEKYLTYRKNTGTVTYLNRCSHTGISCTTCI